MSVYSVLVELIEHKDGTGVFRVGPQSADAGSYPIIETTVGGLSDAIVKLFDDTSWASSGPETYQTEPVIGVDIAPDADGKAG